MKQCVQALILLLAGFAVTSAQSFGPPAPTCPGKMKLIEGRCTHTDFVCRSGTQKTGWGCESQVVSPACPPGFTIGADKVCTQSVPPVVSCPQGLTLSTDRKSCITTAPPAVTCSQGLKLSADGNSCTSVAGALCPSGTDFSRSSKGEIICKYNETPSCAEYTFAIGPGGNGMCVTNPTCQAPLKLKVQPKPGGGSTLFCGL